MMTLISGVVLLLLILVLDWTLRSRDGRRHKGADDLTKNGGPER